MGRVIVLPNIRARREAEARRLRRIQDLAVELLKELDAASDGPDRLGGTEWREARRACLRLFVEAQGAARRLDEDGQG